MSRVDVVFAVDNSTSMQEEIAALQGPVFESFPDALLSVGDGLVDFRLAVVDGCISPAVFHDSGRSGPCQFSTGRNFMVSSSPTFADEYACVMDLSTAGWQGEPDTCSGRNDDEQPASTAAAAMLARGGPNAGFLRDDAALLLVVLTDEDENPIPARAAKTIAADLVEAKADITVLGIGAERDCDGPYGEAYEANTLRAMTDVFVEAVSASGGICVTASSKPRSPRSSGSSTSAGEPYETTDASSLMYSGWPPAARMSRRVEAAGSR